jgi:hypothetical protein
VPVSDPGSHGASTTLHLRGSQLVVAKQRLGPAAAVHAGAEARWLMAARHPGVVALRRVAPGECRIETDHAGLTTLRTHHPDPQGTAEVLGLVAATLAELHRRGLVHGRLRPEHVILGGPRRRHPVLCSPGADPDADPDTDRQGLAHLAGAAAARFAAGRVCSRRQRRRWDDVARTLAESPGLSSRQARYLFDGLLV